MDFALTAEQALDIGVETRAARMLPWQAAAPADAGQPHTLEHGGYGYVDEYPVGKYLRDARVTTVYEGTSQVQKLIIGRALTGESAFV